MYENSRELKNMLRGEYKQRRSEIPVEVRTAYDAKICSAVISLASFRFSSTVLMYAPTKGEIDVMPIATHALKLGKKVAFPLCNAKEHTMEFKLVSDLSQLTEGHYSIPEPPADAETLSDLSGSICLVPGLVFDKEGYRVGYGKGYYDRFLGGYSQSKIGIVYNDFILPEVPRGKFDRHVDILVCERGVKVARSASEKKNR